MNLQREYVDIQDVVFDEKTAVQGHVLHLCRQELADLVQDRCFARVEIDVAKPGENCRIMSIGDVVQPMVRLDDEEATFPGVVGAMRQAGNGRTLCLRGVVVSEVVEVLLNLGNFMDFTGPATQFSEFSGMIHVTIDAFPAQDVSKDDYLHALTVASKKAAKYLAQAAKGCQPDQVETFTLERENLEGLPRVAYLCNAFSHAPLTDFTFYGDSMQTSLPTIVHPNEFLDGAMLDRDYGQLVNADPSYYWQNQPIILELYRRHGVDLNFVGVVLSNTPHTVTDKQRNAMIATGLIHRVLKADGVMITKEGGGHPQVDVQMDVELLEGKYGIATTLVLCEFLSPNNGSYEQVLFTTEYANAMVSTGCVEPLTVGPVEKVIGSNTIPFYPGFGKPGPIDAKAGFIHRNRSVRGSLGQLGGSYFTTRKF